MAAPKRDPGSVFLNVPFDRAYEPFFVTLVSALISLGQTPRCVLEVRERGQGRLARIYELLRSCGVSIHDLSRAGQPVRFNMPFELGLACSIALSGEAHDIAVLDAVPYRLDRTLSDYKGRDPPDLPPPAQWDRRLHRGPLSGRERPHSRRPQGRGPHPPAFGP